MPINTDPPYDRLETILMGGTVDPPYTRKELIAMQAGGGSGGGADPQRAVCDKTYGIIVRLVDDVMQAYFNEPDVGDVSYSMLYNAYNQGHKLYARIENTIFPIALNDYDGELWFECMGSLVSDVLEGDNANELIITKTKFYIVVNEDGYDLSEGFFENSEYIVSGELLQ